MLWDISQIRIWNSEHISTWSLRFTLACGRKHYFFNSSHRILFKSEPAYISILIGIQGHIILRVSHGSKRLLTARQLPPLLSTLATRERPAERVSWWCDLLRVKRILHRSKFGESQGEAASVVHLQSQNGIFVFIHLFGVHSKDISMRDWLYRIIHEFVYT